MNASQEPGQAVRAATRSSEQLGGFDVFLRQTEFCSLYAGMRQRALQRHLDTIGSPGPLAFDPYGRWFELRGTRFEADFIGSMGGDHWLWAWANAYLPLEPVSTAASRQIQEAGGSFLETGCITFGAADTQLVMHRMAGLAVAHASADATYVANGSQIYALAGGQIPFEATMMDLWAAVNDALYTGLLEAETTLAWTADRLGFALTRDGSTRTFSGSGSSLTIQLDDQGRISKVDAAL